MSGEQDRHGQPRRRTWLRRAQATAVCRVEDWQDSPLVRRVQAADVINEGLLFAVVLLLCFLPFLLVIESLSGRTDASGFIGRFGLTGDAAQAVRQALTSPTAPSTAISGLSWVFLILGGIAAAGAIQQLYERVFEVKGRRFRDMPRRVVWLAAALGVCVVGAWTQPWLDRVGGTGLVALAALPVATAFWWFSMWLLLGGKVGWRELFPSALATGICWLGMVIFFRLTLSSTIASDYRKYGSAGVVFAITTLLIAIGVVIMLGALLGVVWRERRRHPPGEQPDSSDQRGGCCPPTPEPSSRKSPAAAQAGTPPTRSSTGTASAMMKNPPGKEKGRPGAMTHIDPRADIQITHDQQDVTARIPLAGQLIPETARHYQKLARIKNLPMQIEELPGRAWIRVQVPANADRDDVEAILDTAHAFLGEAEAAALAEMAATSPAEATVRGWWARQRA